MPSSPPPVRLVRFGIFEANFQAGELRKAGVRIKLQDQPLQILAMLVERPEELVTRDEIRQRLWPDDTFVDFNHGLNNAVNRLRDALGDSAESPRFIETLPRRGYRFIGTVTGSATRKTVVVEAVPPPAQTVGRVSPGTLRNRRYGWIALASGAILIATIAGLNFRIFEARLFPGTLSPLPIRSLAVLPLQNLSGDASQEYFADGMTEALITDLAKISSLRVISRTSAMHYKGSHQALPEITRELNVDAVVEGSVARFGNRVRVTAQLVQVPSDRHLWADSYERDVSDILQLQNELASAVAEKVNRKLTPLEQKPRPVNPEAYEDYLRGRYFANRFSGDDMQRAKDNFESAIQRDPNYAPAYAGLAVTYNSMTFSWLVTMWPDEGAPKAIEALNKALQLDPNLAEPHAALGVIKYRFSGDWIGAEQEFQRAIQLDPGYANAYLWYGWYLSSAGRSEQACANFRKSRQLDPLNSAFVNTVASCLLSEGKYEQAVTEARLAVDLEPRHVGSRWALAGIYEREGRFAEALAEYRKLNEVPGGFCAGYASVHAVAASGRRVEAERMFRKRLRSDKGEVEPWCGAFAYLSIGDTDKAIRSLERAVNEGSPGKAIILAEWRFAPLRSHPRFQALLRRVGVPGW